MNWLQNVFSGEISINARGIAGLVAMALGAVCALFAGRFAKRHAVAAKLAGLALCFIGAIVVIAFGK